MDLRALALTALLAPLAQAARAADGTCIFQVGGRSMIDGACSITDLDGKGSLEIASPDGAYLARIVTQGGGVGEAFWNGGDAQAVEATVGIGTVVLLGACWASDKTKLCTMR